MAVDTDGAAEAAEAGIVILADVIGSRKRAGIAAAWLRRLVAQLDDVTRGERLARFGFTQGDELQGLLRIGVDPLSVVLRGALDEERLPVRWVVVAGVVEPGEGPATERSGPAFFAAREAIQEAARARDGLVMRTGDARSDDLLDGVAPVLAQLLDALSPRQRTIARLALVDGLRQAEIADRLDVSRATVSVTYGRARVRSIERLAATARRLFAEGVAAAGAGATRTGATGAAAAP